MTALYYTGLSGLQLPIPKYKYPPEHAASSRLTYYATFFNSIEINSSFYKIPQKNTLVKWVAQVPDHFRFTFKLFKEITHAKELAFDPAVVDKFMETISVVGDKSACLLIQFPPSQQYSPTQLEKLLQCIAHADPEKRWKVAVEFRNKVWYTEDVNEILFSANATLVIHDKSGSASPLTNPETDFAYVRFHGPGGNYRGDYTNDFLSEYASYINEWLEEGKTVYAYFNNTMGNAFENARTLLKSRNSGQVNIE